MSDTERLNLRDLPPVSDPVDPPSRLSQTFLRHADRCPRSAYLYLRHGGGAPAHNLDFGTAAHMTFERMMLDLIREGQKTLYAPAEGEDAEAAAREVASLTAAVVDEVLRERPELVVGAKDADDLRVLAYHWAVAQDVDPETVVAVERKFVLDLDCGWTVSGKVDLAAMLSFDTLDVVDYKSGFPPAADESEAVDYFQLRMYALLLLYGQPVERRACVDCDGTGSVVPDGSIPCVHCDGSGAVEVRLDPIGAGINFVRPRLVYPRVLRQDGQLHRRPENSVLTRTQVADFKADLERAAEQVSEALESGKWPAVPGSHCSECPCEPECPLPGSLRNHAGEINTVEQAAEAMEWAERNGDRVSALKKELRRFVELHGPIRYGRDKVLELSTSESWATSWPKLEEGVQGAVNYGEPFDLAMFRTRRVSTSLKARTLGPEERGEELDVEAERDARYGETAPW